MEILVSFDRAIQELSNDTKLRYLTLYIGKLWSKKCKNSNFFTIFPIADSGQEWWQPASPQSGDPNALPTQEELYLQHQQHLSRDGRRFGTPREALYAQEQVAIGLQQKFGFL